MSNKRGYNQYKKAGLKFYNNPLFILSTWIAAFVSVGLLYASGKVLSTTIASFRSCNGQDGFVALNCGKSALNFGDLVLFGIFIACIALVMSLFTAGWRQLRRAK